MTKHRRRALSGLLAALLALGAASALAADSGPAEAAAAQWLALLAKGDYGASWTAAAPYFQQHVSKERWEDLARSFETALGANGSRRLRSAEPHTPPAGGPKGEVVILTYDSSFAHRKDIAETVDVEKLGEGWRVVGYHLR
jgi:hypothetical protein